MSLRLSPDLVVPDEYTTEATAILGRRGSGKTNTAVVAVEELLDAGQQVIVVDTVGVWWGLRSDTAGKPGKYGVVIFGGQHKDVPLEESAGKVIAGAIVEHQISAVVDTSSLSKAGARRFLYDFVTEVYHRKGSQRVPVHMVFDEADELAPQKPTIEGARLLNAMEDLVRRGRSRGIGVTLVTQRPAVLNKDVLTQVEVLIAMQMTGPRDVAAIGEWVKLNADDATYQEVRGSLASLNPGEGWLWSPSWLKTLERVQFRKRRTFDSSVTPKIGDQVLTAQPKPIDLAQLGAAIAETVERAKADDPKELRATIKRLEAELAAAAQGDDKTWEAGYQAGKADAVPERVEVPVLTDEDLAHLAGWQDRLGILLDALQQQRIPVDELRNRINATLDPTPAPPRIDPSMRGLETSARNLDTAALAAIPAPRPRANVIEMSNADEGRMGKAERALLSVLVQHGTLTMQRLALLSGYSVKSSSLANALGALRSKGYVNRGGRTDIAATPEGVNALGPVDALPTGEALIHHWMSGLGKAERSILQALIDAYPNSLNNDALADAAGYSVTSSSFANALGRLRSLQLSEGGRDANTVTDTLGEAKGR